MKGRNDQSAGAVAWESTYSSGLHLNRYPYDFVVAFIYHHAPRKVPRSAVQILEVGCGAGNNLWFAAREGFATSGIDRSSSAIVYAEQRFREDGLTGRFEVGDYTYLNYPDKFFDLVVDRGAITYSNFESTRGTVSEIQRVLRPQGKFLFNPYSDQGFDQEMLRGGGSSADPPGILPYRYGWEAVNAIATNGWTVISCEHVSTVDAANAWKVTGGEWRVVLQKAGADST